MAGCFFYAFLLELFCFYGRVVQSRCFNRLPDQSVGVVSAQIKNWAASSAVERYPDKIEVEGPIPSPPMRFLQLANFYDRIKL